MVGSAGTEGECVGVGRKGGQGTEASACCFKLVSFHDTEQFMDKAPQTAPLVSLATSEHAPPLAPARCMGEGIIIAPCPVSGVRVEVTCG